MNTVNMNSSSIFITRNKHNSIASIDEPKPRIKDGDLKKTINLSVDLN